MSGEPKAGEFTKALLLTKEESFLRDYSLIALIFTRHSSLFTRPCSLFRAVVPGFVGTVEELRSVFAGLLFDGHVRFGSAVG